MLLEDLINTKINKKNTNSPLKPSDQTGAFAKGTYSTVKNDAGDPHMIKKSFKNPTKNIEEHDPYWLYIKKIIESGINDGNPYFPRIYNVTELKDLNGKELRRAQIEKLIDSKDLSENDFKMLSIVYQKMGGAENVSTTIDHIIDRLYYNLSGYDLDKIEDSLYLEAVNFIKDIKKSNKKVIYDIHAGNVMFRRNNGGLQLVITDPFYGTIPE